MVTLISKIRQICTNKVVLYLVSRYFTYFIQFLSSIFIAVKLGPYYLGIWGFLLLLLNYFSIFNFGIVYSFSIIIVQNRSNKKYEKDIVFNSLVLIGLLSLLILLCALLYFLHEGVVFEKYQIGAMFYVVCVIAIIRHWNSIFDNVYRVKNKLFEMAFHQSVTPFLVFIILFLFTNRDLLFALLYSYILGELLALYFFLERRKIPWKGRFSSNLCRLILKKGCFLFIYNLCFYLIITSTRTVIGKYYSVEEFGLFTFSYTLANSILIFLQAFGAILFPKIISKLHSNNTQEIIYTINTLRINYISLSYGMIFLAVCLFPILLSFIPKYQNTLLTLILTAMSVLLYTNSFGYFSYLMANNKDKLIAKISIYSLIFNLILLAILVLFLKVSYEYVILSTLLSYLLFGLLGVYYARKYLKLDNRLHVVINNFFPMNLLIPYLSAVILIFLKLTSFLFICFVLYLFLNRMIIKEIMLTIKKIILKPTIVDLD